MKNYLADGVAMRVLHPPTPLSRGIMDNLALLVAVLWCSSFQTYSSDKVPFLICYKYTENE